MTLIELLVVVGIIGIISTVAVPNLMGWYRASKIRTAQREVADVLQRARTRAITKNTQYGVTFAIENESAYWIHQEDPRSIVDSAALGVDTVFGRQPLDVASPQGDKSIRYTLPPNIRFAADNADCPAFVVAGYAPNASAIRFDRYGSETIPGQTNVTGVPVAPALAPGSSTMANRLYHVAGADIAVCLFDTRTSLRRAIRVSPGGRIRTQ